MNGAWTERSKPRFLVRNVLPPEPSYRMQVHGINMNNKKRAFLVAAGVLGLTAIGATQVGQLLKIVGIGAVVQKFGPDINKAMNKLGTHTDTNTSWTKVVPILSVGSRRAIGAAQVMGPRSKVETVKAVAQLDQDFAAPIPCGTPNLVAYYTFDHDAGSTVESCDGGFSLAASPPGQHAWIPSPFP